MRHILFFSLLLLSSWACSQTTSFNNDWKFAAVENSPDNVARQKIGTKWEDQFYIETVTASDTALRRHAAASKQIEEIKNWEDVTLPHTAFLEPLPIKKPREGLAFYKKTFQIPKEYKGKQVMIKFEGAMQVTEVWFNGNYKQQHLGGYLPFIVDISDDAKYGRANTLVLMLNNKANPAVPPGKPVENLDFIYYSGIYRNAWLLVKNAVHISEANDERLQEGGIFVSYKNVSHKKAAILIQTNIENSHGKESAFELTQSLTYNNKAAATATASCRIGKNTNKSFAQELTIENPMLWHPDRPYLYRLKTSVKSKSILDEAETRIGIRSFKLTKEKGLEINGEPFRLAGTNRHQSYPYIGNALSDNASYRDVYLIKAAGMNAIRTAHYPQAPGFYDACNELGLLIVNCIPGWQFFNRDHAFAENVKSDIRQMIRRDRNHPSVLLWEVSLNETNPSAEFRCMQNETAKKEWGNRENFFTGGDSYFVKACWDVPYDDWNGDHGKRNNTTYPENCFLIREYGDYEYGGANSSSRQLRGAGEKALLQQAWNLQWSHNKNRAFSPRCIGDLTWAFYDGLAGAYHGIEAWGAADIFRIPKFSYYFFQSQRSAEVNKEFNLPTGPMIYIADYWDKKTSPSKVIVYSNCDEAALYVNDKLIAKQKPDSQTESDYGTESDQGGKPFDGGNANRLEHPPFTFFNVDFEKGKLKAVGYLKGKQIEDIRFTPTAKPVLKLTTNESVKKWKAGGDLLFVYVSLVDENGMLCDREATIQLTLSGDAKIIGPAQMKAEAGIASFLIQSGKKAGHVEAEAQGENLSGKITLTAN